MPSPDDWTDVDLLRLIRERVEQKRSSGIVVALLDSDGGLRFAAHGDPGPDQLPLAAESVFEVGSVMKVFTAVLLAEMVERGEVELQAPVAQYLPVTVRVPARGEHAMSLVDLATHTSGLPRLPTNLRARDVANPYTDYTVDDLYEFLASYELPRDIGAAWEYSNAGFALLGHVLALRGGKPFEELLRERVLKPLAMGCTSIHVDSALQRHVALPHGERGEVVTPWTFPALPSGGSLWSTPKDLLTFVGANLASPSDVLTRAMESTRTPRARVDEHTRMGLGWHVTTKAKYEIVWKNGGTGGSHAFVGIAPARRCGVIVLSNSVRSIDDIGFHLLDDQVPLEPPSERHEVELPAEILARYVGTYQLAPSITVTVAQSALGLTAEQTGLGAAAMLPESETRFFIEQLPITVDFELDAAGTVTGLIMHRANKDYRAPKVS